MAKILPTIGKAQILSRAVISNVTWCLVNIWFCSCRSQHTYWQNQHAYCLK